MALRAADLLRHFAAAGSLVTASWTPAAGGASATFAAHFRSSGETALEGMAVVDEAEILFATEDAPALTHGDTVTVSAVSYKVREVRRVFDGTVTRAQLRQA